MSWAHPVERSMVPVQPLGGGAIPPEPALGPIGTMEPGPIGGNCCAMAIAVSEISIAILIQRISSTMWC